MLGLVYLALGAYVAWELGRFAESHKGVVRGAPVTTEEYIVFFTPLAGTAIMTFLLIAGLVLLFRKIKPSQPVSGKEPGAGQVPQEPSPKGSSKN